eukprot:CAMPEP_0171247800 /NCGR_PEP_ID=MMETSP0790-20130122/48683_1 /TAXON_ID=2925 /ORGANISM="Alexandrium catenella, Strain OF101" /LENGTH=110 /DNA_ID=CAMNT_0011715223 /DNA_START=35 /DNA_END=364 /DNA_ORIENTATION=-
MALAAAACSRAPESRIAPAGAQDELKVELAEQLSVLETPLAPLPAEVQGRSPAAEPQAPRATGQRRPGVRPRLLCSDAHECNSPAPMQLKVKRGVLLELPACSGRAQEAA